MDKQKAKEKRMNTENLKSQMRKGVLEYCTLLLLSRKRAYTSDIISELKKAHLIVVEGTLYPLLTRLKTMVCLPMNGKNPHKALPANTMSSLP